MLIDWSSKVIQSKIVYYGPAMSGKTTSIRALFGALGQSEKIESIETTTGRTLFFDFGSLELTRNDWALRLYIWSATGQDYYAETRSTVLAGTDGIVFVVDGQSHLLPDNIRSWDELQQFFGNKLGQALPVVVMLNKSDMPNAISRHHITEALNLSNGIHIYPTIATEGVNVSRSFSTILRQIFQ
ncbi:MAG: ATP/GTP-binding protein [Promethearchaeota archaeon]